jgi:hypothetical protein
MLCYYIEYILKIIMSVLLGALVITCVISLIKIGKLLKEINDLYQKERSKNFKNRS